MLNLMFGIITAGTSILIAQYLGAKSERKTIIQVAEISIGINSIIGLIISFVMFFAGFRMMKLLNSPSELIYLGNQ